MLAGTSSPRVWASADGARTKRTLRTKRMLRSILSSKFIYRHRHLEIILRDATGGVGREHDEHIFITGKQDIGMMIVLLGGARDLIDKGRCIEEIFSHEFL